MPITVAPGLTITAIPFPWAEAVPCGRAHSKSTPDVGPHSIVSRAATRTSQRGLSARLGFNHGAAVLRIWQKPLLERGKAERETRAPGLRNKEKIKATWLWSIICGATSLKPRHTHIIFPPTCTHVRHHAKRIEERRNGDQSQRSLRGPRMGIYGHRQGRRAVTRPRNLREG